MFGTGTRLRRRIEWTFTGCERRCHTTPTSNTPAQPDAQGRSPLQRETQGVEELLELPSAAWGPMAKPRIRAWQAIRVPPVMSEGQRSNTGTTRGAPNPTNPAAE